MTADELITFYQNLLTIQYVVKPKARATIETLVSDVVADLIYGQTNDAFDISTAVGKQLDILGEYVGVTRYWYGLDTTKTYWAKLDYGNLSAPDYGWSDYSNLAVGGSFLMYHDLITSSGTLNDIDFRNLIQYQAKRRSISYNIASIDDLLLDFFGDDFYITDNLNMTATYTYSGSEMPVLLKAIIAMNLLPRTAGVSINVV